MSKSDFEMRMDEYNRLLTSAPALPSERSLKLQVALAGKCPFGTREFEDETIGILAARTSEEDPAQNKVAQLRAAGQFMAHMANSPRIDALIGAVEEVATTATGRRQVLKGLDERCSITGVLDLETKLMARWALK